MIKEKFKEEVRTKDEENRQLEERLNVLNGEREKILNDLEEAEKEREAARQKVKDLQNELVSGSGLFKNPDDEAEKKKAENRKIQDSLISDLTKTRSDLNKTRNEKEELMKEKKHVMAEMDTLRKDYGEMVEKTEAKEKNINDLKEKNIKINAEKEKIQTKLKEMEKTVKSNDKELTKLQNQVKEHEQRRQALQEEFLKKETTLKEEKEQELINLKTELSNDNNIKIIEFQKQVSEYEQKLGEAEQKNISFDDLTEKCSQHETNLAQMDQKCGELEKNLENVTIELAAKVTQEEEKKKELADLNKRLKSKESELLERMKKMEDTKECMKQAKDEIGDLKKTLSKLKSQNVELESQKGELKTQNEKLETDLTEQMSNCEQLEHELGQLKEHLEASMAEIEARDKKISKLLTQINSFGAGTSTSSQEVANLKERITKLRSLLKLKDKEINMYKNLAGEGDSEDEIGDSITIKEEPIGSPAPKKRKCE